MKTAIRKIFNKHCTLMNKDYNDYVIRKPNEFIKEIAGLFASLNPERVREVVISAFEDFYAEYEPAFTETDKKFLRDDWENVAGKIVTGISDLCSGSQEKEQAKNECEHNNTEIQDLRCNVCLDCGRIIEMID